MPESLEPHNEDTPRFPEFPPEAVSSPRTLLEAALYSITYYIEHDGDLAQLEQAQELIKRVLRMEDPYNENEHRKDLQDAVYEWLLKNLPESK